MSDRAKKLQIRNSTAEFLTFTAETGDQSIEVLYADENVWATQKMICELYNTSKSNVSEHLSKAFADGEIREDTTVRNFRIVQKEGTRETKDKQTRLAACRNKLYLPQRKN